MTTPTSVPLHLLALERAAVHQEGATDGRAGSPGSTSGDALLRSAIVNVARYYLGLARTRTPAQMEALIWDETSLDGADHGPSGGAFASLTLELAAQAVGQRGWPTGGTSYPWPLPAWADVRVNENPASPGITAMVEDAREHGRWHPLGDGYAPLPGDWLVLSGEVAVVTGVSGGVIDTIAASSGPDLTVSARSFTGPLAPAGVEGFIDNGHLEPAGPGLDAPAGHPPAAPGQAAPGQAGPGQAGPGQAAPGQAAPGQAAPGQAAAGGDGARAAVRPGAAAIPGVVPAASAAARPGAAPSHAAPPRTAPSRAAPPPSAPSRAATATPAPAAGPGPASRSPAPASRAPAPASGTPGPYRKHTAAPPAASAGTGAAAGTRAQQAFISLVAPGAVAAQQRFGVPAAVTIAQAIEESGWGHSELAARYHNLFGIKGTGPAGSVTLPTSEYEGGRWVRVDARFRVYHNVAESITDHAELLATSGYYHRAMADRAVPDAFANDLTGVYATDPEYGANLIALMRLYNLYRFDAPAGPRQPAARAPARHSPAARPSAPAPSAPAPSAPAPRSPAPRSSAPRSSAPPASAPPASAPHAAHRAPRAPARASGPAGAQPAGTAGGAGHGALIPGLVTPGPLRPAPASPAPASQPAAGRAVIPGLAGPGAAGYAAPARYRAELPHAVTTAFFTSAKAPLRHAEQLYREVAGQAGVRWQLLAACDWMECGAHPRCSPVHGERLGTVNPDGTSYATKSEALAQCAGDLIALSAAVYGIDLAAPSPLSVRGLAEVFAAFRWGGLLRRHSVSAMEFPYSVAGLTSQHLRMHWPAIGAAHAPDRPGARFRGAFGAVPVVLSLDYPATV